MSDEDTFDPIDSGPEARDLTRLHELPTTELVLWSKLDDAARNELFRRYQPRLLRIVRIKMGASMRRFVEPDDIVQETCLVAMRKLPDFDALSPSSTLAWFARIAEHVIQNRRRAARAEKRDHRREVSVGGAGSCTDSTGGMALPAPDPTPSEAFSREEVRAGMDACVEALEPDDYRRVILLRDYCSLEWESIQDELGRASVDAVRELHRRARARLRELAARRGYDAL